MQTEKVKYYSRIKGYVASKVENPNDAEDITQQVFLNFHRSNNGNNTLQDPKPYLFVIARNLIAKHNHDKYKQPRIISINEAEAEASLKKEQDYAEQLKMQKLRSILKKSLAQLPTKDYETIRLCIFRKSSIKETARQTGIPVCIYYKRYERALQILRKITEEIFREEIENY